VCEGNSPKCRSVMFGHGPTRRRSPNAELNPFKHKGPYKTNNAWPHGKLVRKSLRTTGRAARVAHDPSHKNFLFVSARPSLLHKCPSESNWEKRREGAQEMEVVTEAEGGSAQRWGAQRWIRADNDDNGFRTTVAKRSSDKLLSGIEMVGGGSG
jgi:hypothetical protein